MPNLKQLSGSIEVINKLVKVELAPRVAFKLHQFATTFDSDIAFFNAERDKILSAHGNKMVEGTSQRYEIPNSALEMVKEKLEELGNIEVPKSYPRIRIDDIPIKITVEDIARIQFILDDTEF